MLSATDIYLISDGQVLDEWDTLEQSAVPTRNEGPRCP
jgi:predicted SnoaL-like aldol condensation-catalyzing enzyme